jgi:tetratricopeptide (TPR) repeat protein
MFFYPRWHVDTKIWWQWLFPFAVIFLLCILAISRRKIGRGGLVLFTFYIISIFPVLGFLNVYGMKFSFVADHFSYLSTPGLLLLLCASTSFFFDSLRSKLPKLHSASFRILWVGLFILIVIYMCGKSILLTRNYKNEITHWSNLIRENPMAWIAYNNLANLYSRMGRNEEVIALYNKAIVLDPNFAEAYNNRGLAYQSQGNLNQALLDYNKAIQIDPNLAGAYYNRGLAYQSQGNLNQALLDYSKAIQINPNFAEAYNNRGLAYQSQGNLNQAFLDYNRAIQINPNFAGAYYNRGLAYQSQGNLNQAISDYSRAIENNPNLAQVYSNRAAAYFGKQEYDKAWQDVHQAEELGYTVNPEFLALLKKASGRDK